MIHIFRPKEKIGLALQGGGARGSYQIGAFYALKKAKIKFDGVCGTSIGALNGAMIASGQEQELLKLWQNLSVGKILDFNHKYIEKKKNKEYDLTYFKLRIQNLFSIVKRGGIPIQGIHTILKENLNKEALLKSKMDFGICTIRIHDLKPMYIFKEKMNTEKIEEYILASCYLPLFKMQKIIDNEYYLDGGFYDNTPVNMLIEKGYEKIYIVELNPLINRKRKPTKKVKTIKITPKRSLGNVIIYDNDTIKENIKMGYFDTLKIIKKLDGFDYCFKNYPLFIYQFVTRKINSKTYNKISGFFHAKTEKETVIKSLEYVMKRENVDYYQIYNPIKMLKQLQNLPKKEHFVYKFIQNLKFL